MKTEIKYLAVVLAISIIVSSFQLIDFPLGPHDGVVKPAGSYNIEMKNTFPTLYAYLLDKNYIPISNKGITCEGRFILADSSTVIIPLKPFEEEGFSMNISSFRYNSCRISFIVFGRRVSAHFESENLIADEKIN